MIDLTPLLQAVISLAAALITLYLIPWIHERTTAEQRAKMRAMIDVAVYGAEKLYGAGHGAEKFAYAQQWLKAQGFDIDLETLKMEIDAAILAMEGEEITIYEDTPEDPPAE